jgi:hypothetical protein
VPPTGEANSGRRPHGADVTIGDGLGMDGEIPVYEYLSYYINIRKYIGDICNTQYSMNIIGDICNIHPR